MHSATMHISSHGITDQGRVRTRNEDAFLCERDHHVYAVADGLGGLPRGALASTIAITTLEQMVLTNPKHRTLDMEAVIRTINDKVVEEGKKVSQDIGIGTTLSVLWIEGNTYKVAHIGDCAIFIFRNGNLIKLTEDHTMEQEIKSRMEPGEETFIPDYFSHTLTRCIGQDAEDLKIDFNSAEMMEGDRVLVCSDGITKTIEADELCALCKSLNNPKAYVENLIQIANDRGGPDNSTAIAIFVGTDSGL